MPEQRIHQLAVKVGVRNGYAIKLSIESTCIFYKSIPQIISLLG